MWAVAWLCAILSGVLTFLVLTRWRPTAPHIFAYTAASLVVLAVAASAFSYVDPKQKHDRYAIAMLVLVAALIAVSTVAWLIVSYRRDALYCLIPPRHYGITSS